MVTKVSEVKDLVKKGIAEPKTAFPEIKRMAASDDWKIREVAATTLVEISKKKPNDVIREVTRWSIDKNPNVRRTASEGLRGVARKDPDKVLPVMDELKTDSNLYVKKSVANVLRNASKRSPIFVLSLCKKWLALKNPNTNWIIKDGLRKLKVSHSKEVKAILESITK